MAATWNSWQLCGGFCFPDLLLIFFIFNHYYLFMPLLCWPGRGGSELTGGLVDAAGLDLFLNYFSFSFLFLIIFYIFLIIFHFWL